MDTEPSFSERYSDKVHEIESRVVNLTRVDRCSFCGSRRSHVEALEAALESLVDYFGCLQPDECGGRIGTCRVCAARKLIEAP